MIIDKNDGMVAHVRMTTEEAKALSLTIKHSHLVVRQIRAECPNVSLEHLSSVFETVVRGELTKFDN